LSINDKAIDEFARALRPGLDELRLRTQSDRPDLQPLLRSEGARGLRALSLRDTGFSDADAEALAGLSNLRRLDVDADGLSRIGLTAIARLPLRRLVIDDGGFALSDLARLADGPCGETLEELQLDQCWPGKGWPSGRFLPRLRRLMLKECSADVSRLGDVVGQLDELELGSTPGVDALASISGPGPRTLGLTWCKIGDAGLARLAAWPGLARVRCLDLSANDIGAAGTRALIASPHNGALEAINLNWNKHAAVGELLRSGLGGRMLWLALSNAAPEEEMEAALAEAHLPRLRELQMGRRQKGYPAYRRSLPNCAVG
jgi:hypothetical protein